MDFTYVDVIGFVAASLVTISFIPQTVRTIKTQDTTGISLWMYVIFIAGMSIGMGYAVLIDRFILFFANLSTILPSLVILFIKIKNVRNGTDK